MKTYTANQIASYLLSRSNAEDNDLSNLKLQKLCYYAQGLVSAMRGGQPLFHEEIAAWDHGPVVPQLYQKYKSHGSKPIPGEPDFDITAIDECDRRALDDVYTYYGQYSAWRLRDMTHEEKPWLDAYNGNKKIPLESLLKYFTPQVDEDYMRKIYGKEPTI